MTTAERDAADLLAREYAVTRSTALRDRVCMTYMPLVGRIAQNMRARLNDRVEHDDLMSWGFVGLRAALDAFEPERGLRFVTFASRRIQGAMLDGVRDADWLGRSIRQRVRKLRDARERFRSEHGREPSGQELYDALGVPDEQFTKMEADERIDRVSLDTPLTTRTAGTAVQGDVLADHREPEPALELQAAEIIDLVLRDFGLQAAVLLRLYFLDGWTLRQCGEALGGLTESQVSYKQRMLLDKVRRRYDPNRRHSLGRAA